MSVVRLVTQILPHSYDHAPAPPPVQGTAIFSENSGVWPEVQAETTVFRCPEGGGDDGRWVGLTELRKSRLRLSACEDAPPPLVRVRPAPGGVLISVPLRISRSDLVQPTKSIVLPKKFRCGICGKGYKTRKPFETHCREHELSKHTKSYLCKPCGLGFHNGALYSAHCKQHHNQPELQTICPNPQQARELS